MFFPHQKMMKTPLKRFKSATDDTDSTGKMECCVRSLNGLKSPNIPLRNLCHPLPLRLSPSVTIGFPRLPSIPYIHNLLFKNYEEIPAIG
jgi:hypothetical protein